MQVRSLGQEYSLVKEMATCSSILAWKVPWTDESGGLQSVGLQRVRHNRAFMQSETHQGLVTFPKLYSDE